jgi:membrane fusion protein (multidrug efflux system)
LAPSKIPAVAVETVPVRETLMADVVTSYGNLVPERSVDIVPESPGQVEKILFTDGQQVVAGAPLVIMNNRIAEAQAQASRAQAVADSQNLQRTRSLAQQGLDSTYTLEQAQTRAAVSQANLVIDQQRLQRLTLRAPFAGTLGTRAVDAGAFLNGGEKIVRLDDVSNLEIEFRMPSSVILHATERMPVHVTIPAGGTNFAVNGELSFVDPAVSTDTRSVLLRAVVPNPGHRLHPGLYVRVSLNLTEHSKALVVPAAAVTSDLGGAYLYVVDDGDIARRRQVTTGLSNGRLVELVSGVKLGERIVMVGQFRLQDGDPVTVEPPDPEPEDGG